LITPDRTQPITLALVWDFVCELIFQLIKVAVVYNLLYNGVQTISTYATFLETKQQGINTNIFSRNIASSNLQCLFFKRINSILIDILTSLSLTVLIDKYH